MGTGSRIDELDCEAELGSGLSQAAFHHIACPQLLACGTHVSCLAGIACTGTPRDHSQVGETRQSGDDVLRESFRQSGKICVRTAVLEG